jgi:hypothetical protein
MSAQGGTLARRGMLHLPILPVAALLVAAIAVAIGMTVFRGTPEAIVTSVSDSERFANSTAAVREQGQVAPVLPAVRPIDPAILEGSNAAVREQGAGLGLQGTVWGTSHVTPSRPTFAGFENPGAYVQGANYVPGLENPTAYPEADTIPTVTWHRPEM